MKIDENSNLSRAFNNCAGKIVADADIERRVMGQLANQLTRDELKAFDTAEDNARMLTTKSFTDTLEKEVGDGTLGVYVVPQGPGNPWPVLFTHVKFLEEFLKVAFPETPASQKIQDAYAQAIEQATDYSREVRQGLSKGEVKPLRPNI